MQCKRLLAVLAATIGLAACSDVPSTPVAPAEARAARQAENAGGPIPGQYLVVFKRDVSDAPGLARRLAAAHGGKVHHSYQYAIKGFAASLSDAAVAALRRNPNVAYVEQDQQVVLATSSWGLDRVDQRDLPLNYTFSHPHTGAGVTVYIIDTGIDMSHPEFGGRATVGLDVVGDGMNGQDCFGHGTQVAGAAGGSTYGLAKSANLVAMRVLNCDARGSAGGVVAAIDWVRNNHARLSVANLSLGFRIMQAVDDAVENLVAAGVTVTVAPGNNAIDACNISPARTPSALTVGASNSGDYQSRFSNYGPCLDLYAPGEDLPTAALWGGMAVVSGTSFSAPLVAGAAALYLEANPWATPADVASAILLDATPDRLWFVGAGSPNLLLYVGAPGGNPPGLFAYIEGPDLVVSGTWTWQAVASGGNGTYSYQWQYSRDGSTWTDVGTDSPTYDRYVGSWTMRYFYLRVVVTSNGVSYTSAPFQVVTDCSDGMC